jgi:hypothetical protein
MPVASRALMARSGEMVVSVFCFAAVVGGLFFLDPRVRVQMESLADGGIGPWQHRVTSLASSLFTSIHSQSVENGTWVLFAVVGILLFFFMLKT